MLHELSGKWLPALGSVRRNDEAMFPGRGIQCGLGREELVFQVEQLALTQEHRSPVRTLLLPRPLSQGSLAHLCCSLAQDKPSS